MYNMTKEERLELGLKGNSYVDRKYNFKGYIIRWHQLLKDIHEREGSWETRKERKTWELLEV